jgi:putative chitinase
MTHNRVVLSLPQFRGAMPTLNNVVAREYLPFLQEGMDTFGISDSRVRVADFLAQIGHESLDLTRMREMDHRRAVKGCGLCAGGKVPHVAGEQYEGRSDLGNTTRGDGVKFPGYGALQYTGRRNALWGTMHLNRILSKDRQVDFVQHPAKMAQKEYTFLLAALYWKEHGCNELSDIDRFDKVTRAINGGLNGLADRLERRHRCRLLLGIEPAFKVA